MLLGDWESFEISVDNGWILLDLFVLLSKDGTGRNLHLLPGIFKLYLIFYWGLVEFSTVEKCTRMKKS